MVGQRVALSVSSNFIALLLLTVVPAYAVLAGHVRSPHVMISDVVAAGPMYKGFYIFGFTYAAYGSNSIWTEVMRHIKVQAPVLRQAADRFLILLHWVVLPCLLLLSAFTFDHEEPEYHADYSGQESYFDMLPKSASGFINWLVHVIATSFFFLGAAVCGGIYMQCIMPHMKSKGLVHPEDLAWLRLSCSGLILGFISCVVVRVLHIFHSPYFWCWPLGVLEAALILFCIMANAMGTHQFLRELDRFEPSIDFTAALTLLP